MAAKFRALAPASIVALSGHAICLEGVPANPPEARPVEVPKFEQRGGQIAALHILLPPPRLATLGHANRERAQRSSPPRCTRAKVFECRQIDAQTAAK